MSDPTDAKQARHLEGIDKSMREISAIFKTFNENFVKAVAKLEAWNQQFVAEYPEVGVHKEESP
jgi:hypothetical protein